MSVPWIPGLDPVLGGIRGKETGLEGVGVAIGSALGNLTSPGPAIGGKGVAGDTL